MIFFTIEILSYFFQPDVIIHLGFFDQSVIEMQFVFLQNASEIVFEANGSRWYKLPGAGIRQADRMYSSWNFLYIYTNKIPLKV